MSKPARKTPRPSVALFDVAAVVLAFPLAIATHDRLAEQPWVLFLAFALALVVGARLGWRALVTVAGREDARPYDVLRSGAESVGSLPVRTVASTRAPRPEVPCAGGESAIGASGSGVPAPSKVRAEGVLDTIRSCMDEVSYTPGSPNVLSMTKYLDDEDATPHAPERGDANHASVVGHDDQWTGISRVDDGDETVLRIEGVLDAVTSEQLRPVLDALVTEQRKAITLELSSLRLIDSTGVGLIVALMKRCKTFRGAVRVSGLKDQPLSIFRLLRLDRVFAVR